ncbi:hypothetical protein ACWCPM_11095 [Streptomyces sp. NPDC002309]
MDLAGEGPARRRTVQLLDGDAAEPCRFGAGSLPREPAADARPGSAYVYGFAWPSLRPGLGACHALELGFVFDTGEAPESARLAGWGAPAGLADALHSAWVRFAAEGDPGRQPWDDTHPVRVFGEGGAGERDERAGRAEPGPTREPHTAYGPRDREFALWAADPGGRGTASAPDPDAAAPRTAEPRSVVRLLRRTSGVRRQ